jgi:predicted small lipoprotein YifL
MLSSCRKLNRLLLAGALLGALGLAACGKKGALDLPPASVASPATTVAPPDEPPATEPLFSNTRQNKRAVSAPKGEKKHIPLDVLID